jgi:hypothetical protein
LIVVRPRKSAFDIQLIRRSHWTRRMKDGKGYWDIKLTCLDR